MSENRQKGQKMKKGYIAGPLFSSAEVRERIREGKILREEFPDIAWYNPIEEPINDKAKLPTAGDIFKGDFDAVTESDVIVADLTGIDTGVAMELGIAIGIKKALETLKEVLDEETEDENFKGRILEKLKEKGIRERKVYCHNSDIRIATSGEYKNHYVPYGQNQFVIGGVEYLGNTVFSSMEEASESMKESSSLNNRKEV